MLDIIQKRIKDIKEADKSFVLKFSEKFPPIFENKDVFDSLLDIDKCLRRVNFKFIKNENNVLRLFSSKFANLFEEKSYEELCERYGDIECTTIRDLYKVLYITNLRKIKASYSENGKEKFYEFNGGSELKDWIVKMISYIDTTYKNFYNRNRGCDFTEAEKKAIEKIIEGVDSGKIESNEYFHFAKEALQTIKILDFTFDE